MNVEIGAPRWIALSWPAGVSRQWAPPPSAITWLPPRSTTTSLSRADTVRESAPNVAQTTRFRVMNGHNRRWLRSRWQCAWTRSPSGGTGQSCARARSAAAEVAGDPLPADFVHHNRTRRLMSAPGAACHSGDSAKCGEGDPHREYRGRVCGPRGCSRGSLVKNIRSPPRGSKRADRKGEARLDVRSLACLHDQDSTGQLLSR